MSEIRLGDLKQHSVSFAEVVALSRSLREKVFDKGTEMALDALVEHFAPGVHQAMERNSLDHVPKDLATQFDDGKGAVMQWIKAYVGSGRMGSLAARVMNAIDSFELDIGPEMEDVVEAVADLRLRRLMNNLILAARANQIAIHDSPLRIVKRGITYYSAKTQSNWSGTLAEFRFGTVLSGPADPREHFTIYMPGQQLKLRGDFKVTHIVSAYQ